jgi:hypothetical protein
VLPERAARAFCGAFLFLVALDLALGAKAFHPARGFYVSKAPLLFEANPVVPWVPDAHTLTALSLVGALAAAAACLALFDTPRSPVWLAASAIAAAAYNIAFWGNAADAFQHHYLISMLLLLVPLYPYTPWAQRLCALQVGLVYFWAVVTKVADGGLFLSGAFSAMFVRNAGVHSAVFGAARFLGLESDMLLWRAMAWAVVGAEANLTLVLCTSPSWWLQSARAWKLRTAILLAGIAMHLGFEFVGSLRIGRFSWYMVAILAAQIPRPVVLQGKITRN